MFYAEGSSGFDPIYPFVDASRAMLQMNKDRVETRMREEGCKAVSVERFSERMEMFERLLGFVGGG